MASKTLLCLGGAQHQVTAIETAKRLGVRTVLCDYLPDNPGQHVADRFYLKSTTDFDEMLQVARDERVDGVISFGSDAAAPIAAKVCEELGLPTNPYRSVLTLSEKYLFRDYLRDHGFNCPAHVSFPSTVTPAQLVDLLDGAGVRVPLLLKPTDSSGSKGVTVLRQLGRDRLEAALDYAREYSRNGTLIAEEFIEAEYPHVIGGDIFVAKGEVRFWGLMDCLRDEAANGLVPVGKAYPCGLGDERRRRLQDEVNRLVQSLGLSFGEMNLEVIVARGGVPYIVELGGRAGGNLIPAQLTQVSGIDLVEACVRYALGDESMDVSFDGGGRCVASYVLHPTGKAGTFQGVSIDPCIRDNVMRVQYYQPIGTPVQWLVNSGQTLGVVFLEFGRPEVMRETMARIGELVSAKVE
jgi:biotin carboxylase